MSLTVVQLIARFAGRRNLDLGCGAGRYAQCFPNDTVGLEVDSVKARRVRREYWAVVIGSADHLPFRNEAFNFALSTEVLEHLVMEASLQALREIERVAQHSVVTTPNRNFLFAVLSKAFYGAEQPDHLSFWRPSELRSCGWRVRGCLGLVTWYRIPAEPIRRLWNRLAWFLPDLFAGDIVCFR